MFIVGPVDGNYQASAIRRLAMSISRFIAASFYLCVFGSCICHGNVKVSAARARTFWVLT